MFDVDQAQPPQEFLIRKALFEIHGGAADRGDAFRAVDGLAFIVCRFKA